MKPKAKERILRTTYYFTH